tara:strand:+ start:803 stop:1363 length:561 start_codon:yes stop_codon:yes gene_type:complete
MNRSALKMSLIGITFFVISAIFIKSFLNDLVPKYATISTNPALAQERNTLVADLEVNHVDSSVYDSLKYYDLNEINIDSSIIWLEKAWIRKFTFVFFKKIEITDHLALAYIIPNKEEFGDRLVLLSFSHAYQGDWRSRYTGVGNVLMSAVSDSVANLDTLRFDVKFSDDAMNWKNFGSVEVVRKEL